MSTLFTRGGIYWIDHGTKNGRRIRETTGTSNLEEAEEILAKAVQNGMTVYQMLAEYQQLKQRVGAFEMLFPQAAPKVRKIPTVGALLDRLLANYEALGRKSLPIVKMIIEGKLRPEFGHLPANELTTEVMEAYVAKRKGEGWKPISTNNHLGLLRRAFVLAKRQIGDLPDFPMVPGAKKSREGFYTEAELSQFCDKAPAYLIALYKVAAWTGFRRGELLRLEWGNVDLESGLIKLEAGTTKNGDARTSPIHQALRPVLEAQKEYTEVVQRQLGKIIPHVFHIEGEPISITRLRDDRVKTCKAAGMKKMFHDLRRTFRKKLEDSGIAPKEGMKLMGQRDIKVYFDYKPTTTGDLVNAIGKIKAV